MENMRFMTNMNDQYTNESDNEEDGNEDVEDIGSSDKLVNYFNNGNNYYNDDDDDDDNDMMITIGTWVMMTMCMEMPIKEGDSLLRAVFLEAIIVGKSLMVEF